MIFKITQILFTVSVDHFNFTRNSCESREINFIKVNKCSNFLLQIFTPYIEWILVLNRLLRFPK